MNTLCRGQTAAKIDFHPLNHTVNKHIVQRTEHTAHKAIQLSTQFDLISNQGKVPRDACHFGCYGELHILWKPLLDVLKQTFAKKNIGPVAYAGRALQGCSNSLPLFSLSPLGQLLQASAHQSGRLRIQNLLLITVLTIPNLFTGASNQTASSRVNQKALAGFSFLRFQAGYINYC